MLDAARIMPMRSKITSICSSGSSGTVPSRRAPTCPLQNRSLAFGGISMPCAALLEWAQTRSLSVWTVNILAFLLSRAIGLIAGPGYPVCAKPGLRTRSKFTSLAGEARQGPPWHNAIAPSEAEGKLSGRRSPGLARLLRTLGLVGIARPQPRCPRQRGHAERLQHH